MRDEDERSVKKIRVVAREPNEEPQLLDLITERLQDSETVEPARERNVPYERRRTALRQVWHRHRDDVRRIFAEREARREVKLSSAVEHWYPYVIGAACGAAFGWRIVPHSRFTPTAMGGFFGSILTVSAIAAGLSGSLTVGALLNRKQTCRERSCGSRRLARNASICHDCDQVVVWTYRSKCNWVVCS